MNYIWIIEARPVKGNCRWGIYDPHGYMNRNDAKKAIVQAADVWHEVAFRVVKYQRVEGE